MNTTDHRPSTLLRDFVNTRDVETGEDAIDSPAGLRAWLADRGLAPDDATVTPDDVAAALTLREALREAMRAHHDGDDAVPAGLVAAAAPFPLRLTDRDGRPALAPVAVGVAGGLGHLVAAVVASAADHTWERLKVCVEDTCQWAFLDASKNRSRHWCSMQVCGNRTKTRAYRARRRGAGASSRSSQLAAGRP